MLASKKFYIERWEMLLFSLAEGKKKRAWFLALAGANLFQFEINNLNSVNYQFLSEVIGS